MHTLRPYLRPSTQAISSIAAVNVAGDILSFPSDLCFSKRADMDHPAHVCRLLLIGKQLIVGIVWVIVSSLRTVPMMNDGAQNPLARQGKCGEISDAIASKYTST